jgi:hypothetical protein
LGTKRLRQAFALGGSASALCRHDVSALCRRDMTERQCFRSGCEMYVRVCLTAVIIDSL